MKKISFFLLLCSLVAEGQILTDTGAVRTARPGAATAQNIPLREDPTGNVDAASPPAAAVPTFQTGEQTGGVPAAFPRGITGQTAITNAGVFSGLNTEQAYLSSNVGGFSNSLSFTCPPICMPNDLDVIAGKLVLPADGTNLIFNGNAVGGFCASAADSRLKGTGHPGNHNNCNSFFGIAQATASNAGVGGLNVTVGDAPSTSNTFIDTQENDVWVNGEPRFVVGSSVALNGAGKVPQDAGHASAYLVYPTMGSSGHSWAASYYSSDKATQTAFFSGASGCSGAGQTCPSQFTTFNSWNGGRTPVTSYFFAEADGSFHFNAASGKMKLNGTRDQISFVGNANATTISVSNPAAARTWSIADLGGNADFAASNRPQNWSGNQRNVALVTPTIGGGATLNLFKTATDSPGNITVSANSCIDRSVAIPGLAASAVIIPTAHYALEDNISLSAGQAAAGTAHYRICNVSGASVTLNASSTFNLAIIQ